MRWQIHHLDMVVSTNQTAHSFPVNSVIVAQQQSGGRGRYGRVWESPKGNLYLSVVVGDYEYQTPLLAFVAGVAVAEALSDYPVRLKWPNDVLLDGRKLAGILLERTDDGRTIIGIGVNVASNPTQGMLYETASLGGTVSVATVEANVLSALDMYLTQFETTGFAGIRDRWLHYAAGIGKEVTVRLPDRQLSGIFQEFSPEGALVLATSDKTILISAGDVFLSKGK